MELYIYPYHQCCFNLLQHASSSAPSQLVLKLFADTSPTPAAELQELEEFPCDWDGYIGFKHWEYWIFNIYIY